MPAVLNIQGASDVRQTEIHTAEPLWPEPSASEFELAIAKLKSNKSPGIDQIPAELVNLLAPELLLFFILAHPVYKM